MSVIRVEKNKNYTVMSNAHLQEKDMSLKAKGLLCVVLALPDTWEYSIAGLVSICKENETAIRNTLKELKDFGYLEIIKKTSDITESHKFEYEYIFYECPQVKNPGIENLYVENPYVDNPIQLNTNKINTKITNTKNILGATKVAPTFTIKNTQSNSCNSYNAVDGLVTLPHSPQTPPSPNLLDKVEKKPKKRKTKQEKIVEWVNKNMTNIEIYGFSDSVKEKLEKYFNYLANFGTLIPWESLELQMSKLVSVSRNKQSEIIDTTIARGWKSLVYVIEQNKKSEQDLPSYRIVGGENGRSKEERQAWVDKHKNTKI